jgi:hypothetical protein
MSGRTADFFRLLRTAFQESRNAIAHSLGDDAQPDKCLDIVLSALFDDRVTEAIGHNPDLDHSCPDYLRDDFLTLSRAAETARLVMERHCRPPCHYPEQLCLEILAPILENSIVDAAGGFAPLFSVDYDLDDDDP